MKYITVIFWTLVLGEVLGYIGSALETATFNPELTAIWSVIVGTIGAVLFYTISNSADTSKQN